MTTAISNLRIGFRLITIDGTIVFTSGDTDPEGLGTLRAPGRYLSTCAVPGNLLSSGVYHITVACDRPMQETLVFQENIISFDVLLSGGVGGSVKDGRQGVVRPFLWWKVSEKTQ